MIRGNKLLPDFIIIGDVSKKEDTHPFEKLNQEQQRRIFDHGIDIRIINIKPWLKKLVEDRETKLLGIYGRQIRSTEFSVLANRLRNSGWYIVPFEKMIHGGGRGSRGWSKIFISKTNILKKILDEMGIYEYWSKLNPTKRIARLSKLFGEQIAFSKVPKVVIGPASDLPGIIYVSEEFASNEKIPFGGKLTGAVKAQAIPTKMNFGGDIFVPADELKIPVPANKLGNFIFRVPSLDPEKRFSRNLMKPNGKIGRCPINSLHIQSMYDIPIKLLDFSKEQEFVETGLGDPKLIWNLFGFKDSNGQRMRNEGIMISLGIPGHFIKTINEVRKIQWNWIKKKFQGYLNGIYGVIMDGRLCPGNVKSKRGLFSRWPWLFFIEIEYKLYKNIIFIDTDLLHLFGGDNDGDLGVVLHRNEIETSFSYPRDKEILKVIMKPPEKEEESKEMTEDEVITRCLEQYEGCGRVFNNGQIVIETAKLNGMNKKDVLSLYGKINATIVQPWINGFKGKGGEKILNPLQIAKLFNVDTKNIGRASFFFKLVQGRTGDIDAAIIASKIANPKSPFLYERVIGSLKWNLPNTITEFETIPVELEKKIRQSYLKHRNNHELRYAEILGNIKDKDTALKIVQNCFIRNDIRFGTFIMGKWNIEIPKPEDKKEGGD